MFEKRFIPEVLNVPEGSEKHSELTVDMFNYMIEKNGLRAEMERYGIKPDEDCPTIQNLIKGDPEAGDKAFLYEITENKWNGVDVNKFDYFARDCHHLGISNSFDHQRLLKCARVCKVNRKNHICFSDKEADNIYEMFRTHYNLHRQAYQHKTVSIIEIMMKDAFFKANEVLHFSADLNNMEKYSKLTCIRPLSSMCPTIIMDEHKQVIMVVGASGGTDIITATAQVILNYLYFDNDVKKAVDVPRFKHGDSIKMYAEDGFDKAVLKKLKEKYNDVKYNVSWWGRVQAVVREDDEQLSAASDARKYSFPAGY